jgi:hypothetical protein
MFAITKESHSHQVPTTGYGYSVPAVVGWYGTRKPVGRQTLRGAL